MRMTMLVAALALLATGCDKKKADPAKKTDPTATASGSAPVADPGSATAATGSGSADMAGSATAATGEKKLFMDVHDLGAGKVTAAAVADAHKKDLATQGKHGVEYKAYWVDEKAGKIYCLAEAPNAEAANTVHKEAHGLVANKIMEVKADTADWKPDAGMKLFMDIHNLGAGKVTAEAVADAHKKDLAVQDKHKVKYLNYWVDTSSGTIMCLSQAPSKEASLAVHKEAHGLMPDTVTEVSEGR